MWGPSRRGGAVVTSPFFMATHSACANGQINASAPGPLPYECDVRWLSTHPTPLHPTERYGAWTQCFGGRTFLTTRAQLGRRTASDPDHSPCWATLIRPYNTSSGLLGNASLLLPPSLHLAHNTAVVCINETLHVIGGQLAPPDLSARRAATAQIMGIHRGVFHTPISRAPGSAPIDYSASTPRLVFDTPTLHRMRCIERRQAMHSRCQFDGKFSSVHWRGRIWLFARANIAPQGGARHVQVTHATIDSSAARQSFPTREWADWALLHIEGVPVALDQRRSSAHGSRSPTFTSFNAEDNIYYFNVQLSSDGQGLLATFPAVLNGTGGVYLSSSTVIASKASTHSVPCPLSTAHSHVLYSSRHECIVRRTQDGLRWERPRLLVRSEVIGPRVLDHPVGIWPPPPYEMLRHEPNHGAGHNDGPRNGNGNGHDDGQRQQATAPALHVLRHVSHFDSVPSRAVAVQRELERMVRDEEESAGAVAGVLGMNASSTVGEKRARDGLLTKAEYWACMQKPTDAARLYCIRHAKATSMAAMAPPELVWHALPNLATPRGSIPEVLSRTNTTAWHVIPASPMSIRCSPKLVKRIGYDGVSIRVPKCRAPHFAHVCKGWVSSSLLN